uniref:Glycosylphosphatidylinositol anchor biosynthesis protein 11 n=1 Tax=Blastobotrys adeninivorans TaxID=409370 RepID=A0A060T8U2_BLAAD
MVKKGGPVVGGSNGRGSPGHVDRHGYESSEGSKLLQGSAYAVVLTAFWYGLVIKGKLYRDPVGALVESAPALVLIQILYSIFGGLASRSPTSKRGSKKTKSRSDGESFGTLATTAILASILSGIMSVLVFALLILFGAPATTYLGETFLCALHISVLSVQPLVFVYNLDSNIWKDIISVNLPLNGVYGASVGTWLGAWLGAIVIPLDWDRPWQRWPLPIVGGAYLGTAIGTIVGVVVKKVRT